MKVSPASTRRQLEHGVGSGEPNNIEREKCGEMMKNGKYNSIPCQAHSYDDNPGYICEKHFSKFMIMPKLCYPN